MNFSRVWRNRGLTISGIVLIALILIRLALPFVLKSYINRTLSDLNGYSGHVESIHLAIWRGTYEANDIKIVKTEAKHKIPFFSADQVSVALDWRALLQGHMKTKIIMQHPMLQLIKAPSAAQSQTSVDTETWQEKLTKLYPFDINKFQIYDGFIRFENKNTNPKINFFASNLKLVADNISNTSHSNDRLPSYVEFHGRLLKSGRMTAAAQFNLASDPVELDFKGTMKGLNLKEINDFARAYGNFDFEKGRLDVAMELAASRTNYVGYVKTALIAPKVLDWSKEQKEGKPLGNLLWQGLVGTLMDLFKNHSRNQFAARIPLTGSRDDLHINSWAAVGSILRNAFVEALNPKLEDSVKFSDAVQSGSTQSADPAKSKSKDKKK